MDIINLKPQRVWKHFYSLTQIPRPSKKEEKIRAFLAEFGRNLGLETIVDETCLLYTSDAADDLLCVDLGGSRIIKKKKYKNKMVSIHLQ